MMKTVQLKRRASDRAKKGYPLLVAGDFDRAPSLKDGELFRVVGSDQQMIGTAYYGLQNKGSGWIISKREETALDVGFFEQLFGRAEAHRGALRHDEQTTAYRLFNGEGDHFGGITIDRYDGYVLIQWYSEGVYTFREQIYDAIDRVWAPVGIYEKVRFDKDGKYIEKDDFVRGTRGEFPMIVLENGIRYATNLNDGAMTGIFLDQRNVRQALCETYAAGKTVLNTFSYTGAFSVAAKMGGATKTTSVDLAKRSEPLTIEQFSVNGIDFEQEEIRVMDVFNYFNYADRHQLTWDVVVLDPPSFARSKKRTFSTSKDYPMLIERAAKVTAPNGLIIASTNNASFGMNQFKEMIEDGMKQARRRYEIVEQHTLPDDFRVLPKFKEFDYLKVCFIRCMDN